MIRSGGRAIKTRFVSSAAGRKAITHHHTQHYCLPRNRPNVLTMRSKGGIVHPGVAATAGIALFSTCCPTLTTSGFELQRLALVPRHQQQFHRKRISSKLSPVTHTRVYATKAPTEEEESASDPGGGSDTDSFATSYHAPVMWKECIDGLLDCQRSRARRTEEDDTDNNNGLVFIDGTLGGGGHSAALLGQLQPGDIVIGCDVDPMALQTASNRLKDYVADPSTDLSKPHFIPVQTNFGNLVAALGGVQHPITKEAITKDGVDGILLDLGVSSFQIDTPERGFAFMKDGPLDMRMNSGTTPEGASSGLTAADICNEFDLQELQRIFSVYGDEPKSKTIAQAIVGARPITTTQQLTSAIASVTPKFVKRNKRMGQTATFARIFQALRIVVNNEDGVLTKVFEDACPTLLREGGRLVVLSYHSMEDRATKRIMRDGKVNLTSRSRKQQEDQKDIYGNYVGPTKPFKPIGKRRKAREEEVTQNSRARSASLRIAERQ